MKRSFWLSVTALCLTLPGVAQGVLQGKVIDPTGAPIPGATVTVLDGVSHRFSLTTDPAGHFSVADGPGIYDTTVSAVGFAPVHSDMTYATDAIAVITLQPVGSSGVTPEPERALPTSASSKTTIPPTSGAHRWEYGGVFQGGLGVTDNRGGFKFLAAGGHVGRVLTADLGTGFLKGNFEYAVELFPYWQAFTPKFQRIQCPAPIGSQVVIPGSCSAPYTVGGTSHGVSVTPIILRWNFTHSARVQPWAQAAGGLLWTNHKFPAYGGLDAQNVALTGPNSDTSVWNFTPQGGIGAHFFTRPNRSIDLSANAVHISSASLGDRNPGVNASVQFTIGYTWWK